MVSHRVKRAIPCEVGAPQQAIRRFDVPLHKRQVGVQHLSISGGTCSSRWLLDLYVITHVQRVAILDLPRGDVSCTMTRATTAGEGSITCAQAREQLDGTVCVPRKYSTSTSLKYAGDMPSLWRTSDKLASAPLVPARSRLAQSTPTLVAI